ncbi:hypothetical protein M2T92_16450 [Elizabethkingia miricola]|uniref:hypothetical protein n=1 Tax=Elizabethkingia miricola TaxID=172045 RepID=UPI0020138FF5|nr:hypothetical protein [Elizabethkingia miricola]MCL1680631.1 hypothetical protein [Elizabethkingia miricola]
MPIEAKVVLGYKNIFGISSSANVIETISGICPDVLLLILCNTSSLLFNQKTSKYIYSLFVSTGTKVIYSREIQQISFILNQKKENEIFNEKTNSEFLKIIIENYNYLKEKKVGRDFIFIEFSFLKAYLILNEIAYLSKYEGKLFLDIPKEYYAEFGQIILGKKTVRYYCGSNFYYEFLKIKTLLYHYYCNERDILDKFYKINAIEYPDLWIFDVFQLLTLGDKSIFIEPGHWMWKYCEETKINNFFNTPVTDTELRLNPLFLHDGKYAILKWTFFLQHLFYKIYYKLFQLYRAKYNEKLTFGNYKSNISNLISEKILFRKVIEKSFNSKGVFIKFDDQEIDGFSDCYLRYNNSVLLFEFKDNAIGEDFIENDSYQYVKSYIDERFIGSKKKGKPKGISQLVNSINYLNENIESIDPLLLNKYKQRSVDIYPIIVVSDEMFSQSALESYLTKEFGKIKPHANFRNIKDLIVINISSLIDYFLSSEKTNYTHIIKQYSNKKKKFRSKDLFPNFPDIESISYPRSFKTKSLLAFIKELPICDLSIDEQFEQIKKKEI